MKSYCIVRIVPYGKSDRINSVHQTIIYTLIKIFFRRKCKLFTSNARLLNGWLAEELMTMDSPHHPVQTLIVPGYRIFQRLKMGHDSALRQRLANRQLDLLAQIMTLLDSP